MYTHIWCSLRKHISKWNGYSVGSRSTRCLYVVKVNCLASGIWRLSNILTSSVSRWCSCQTLPLLKRRRKDWQWWLLSTYVVLGCQAFTFTHDSLTPIQRWPKQWDELAGPCCPPTSNKKVLHIYYMYTIPLTVNTIRTICTGSCNKLVPREKLAWSGSFWYVSLWPELLALPWEYNVSG